MIERSRIRIPAGAAEEFSSPGSTLCANSFQYPFHPRVPAIVRKRSCSFCREEEVTTEVKRLTGRGGDNRSEKIDGKKR